ncbi:MAG: hypothetical protein PHP93_03360 [Kiritimatiellales bacterium]|nr:hypothetical protein [Kiritimatiellales bacterium]
MTDSHSAEQAEPRIPPIPSPQQQAAERPATFETNYRDMDNNRHLFQVVDAVLKRPAQVLYEILHGKSVAITVTLLVIAVFCLTAIGLMMAGYSGGEQFAAVPLKVVIGTLLSAAICLPSLYILLCLSGGDQTFPQVCSILLQSLALTGILFVGFLPVAWIFSQATDSIKFMGFLYLLIWGVGIHFGLRLLRRAFAFLNKRTMGTLHLWGFIFILVLLQMSTTLRPLLGSYGSLRTNEKKFFVTHWFGAGDHTDKPATPPRLPDVR